MILDLIGLIKKSRVTLIGSDSGGELYASKFLKMFDGLKVIYPKDFVAGEFNKEDLICCDFFNDPIHSSFYDKTMRKINYSERLSKEIHSIKNAVIFYFPIYKSRAGTVANFVGAGNLLYYSNLDLVFSDNIISTTKNRINDLNKNISFYEIDKAFRNLSIDSVLDL